MIYGSTLATSAQTEVETFVFLIKQSHQKWLYNTRVQGRVCEFTDVSGSCAPRGEFSGIFVHPSQKQIKCLWWVTLSFSEYEK